MFRNSIEHQIWKHRKNANMSQMELSLAMGYKTNVIGLIENGKRKATVDLLTKMNNHFGWEFTFKKTV